MSLREPTVSEAIDLSSGRAAWFPRELPEFSIGLIITPSWARECEDPVVVSGHQGSRYHEPDLGALEPAPKCWYANKDVEWEVKERAFEDGWTPHCDVCPEVGDE